jgi:hypothetical protein
MSKEYQFSIPDEEKQAVARGLARMKGLDPDAIQERGGEDWRNCLFWAGLIILANQYGQQSSDPSRSKLAAS